jgi:hypothetical protein
MQDALAEHGVGDTMKQYVDAIDAGEQVPEDVRRELTNLLDHQKGLMRTIIPMAVRWVRREDAAHQLAAELEQQLAQSEAAAPAIERPAPE